MKKILFVGIIMGSLVPLAALAQEIPAPPPSTVTVTDHCTATDGGSNSIDYTGQFLGICALLAAKDQGTVSSYQLSYSSSFGFFLSSLNGITPSGTQFWDIQQNGADAQVGLSSLTLSAGDKLSFLLEQCTDDFSTCSPNGTSVSFFVNLQGSAAVTGGTGGGGSGGVWYHAPFDVPEAFGYLASVQAADGSFGSPMLNDWVAVATAAGDSGPIRNKLASYELSHPVLSPVTTENERHAMALEALGINPYDAGGQDYISIIVRAFDGAQIGDPSLVNDDIFALFPLLHAGYTLQDPIIASTTAFIISRQGADGSWVGSVDLTAAAIQVLRLLPDTGDVRYVISKATGYLHGKQHGDGGFGDPYSSSWILQAISSMNDTSSDWQQSHNTPDYYLATLQAADGGVVASSTEDRIWATAYAIPGIRRATWDSLLKNFPKPISLPPTAAATAGTSTSTAGTTTPDVSAAQEPQVPSGTVQDPPAPAETPAADASSSQTAAVASFDPTVGSSLDYVSLYLLLLLIYLGAFAYRFRKRASSADTDIV